ncbi:pentapeptide repeat-containing protein [Actinomadura sp. 1N219]|uniref:pentapeptide repeat-containing protein n=1 Tax=Actinomadura sp. 1N219 TaxID=3375152 RepID=UPI00378E3251
MRTCGANLKGAHLAHANLNRAVLVGADLWRADPVGADGLASGARSRRPAGGHVRTP